MSLKEYKAKRDFGKTEEPAGKEHSEMQSRELSFVIQKHAASRLHYDFRLEMEGVLKSWAVPKGLPTARGDRRLAVQVEDHPIEYVNFEGTIPEGNYGAGTVMVWDHGTYSVSGVDPLQALEQGKIRLSLKGKKLKGEWTLVRMRPRENENKPQWLVLKSGEDISPLSDRAENTSAVTKRSMEQIAAKNERQWESDRPVARRTGRQRLATLKHGVSAPTQRAKARSSAPSAPTLPKAKVKLERLPKAPPQFVEPMKALLAETLPKGDQWIYEIKFDGVRALAIKDQDKVHLISRSAKDLTGTYPQLASALEKLPARQAVLDGEVVAVDDEGRSRFQLLQCYNQPSATKPPLFYYVFDLINLEGKDLWALPLTKRKAMAEALVANLSPAIRFSASIKAESAKLMREMQTRGLEGLIAKKKESKYESGRRSGAWVKFKWSNEQEFVIGGYTEPQGTRTHFGAILVGYYAGKKLMFAGKVGTGFDQKMLASLHHKFQKLVRDNCPFANLPERLGSSRSGGLTASQMRHCIWLEPKLVCQVRFAEWTRDNHLRQPAFLGLHEDKRPEEVVREKAS